VTPDRFAAATNVADAVLYEGYVLYPYRASAAKNQIRWQFGVLAPQAYCEAGGPEKSIMRTECILEAGGRAWLDVRIRCLQVQTRTVEKADGDGFTLVDVLEVDRQSWSTWDEASEQEINVTDLNLDDLIREGRQQRIDLPAARSEELLRGSTGDVVGRLVRVRRPVTGWIRVDASWCPGPYPLAKITATVENTTPWSDDDGRAWGRGPHAPEEAGVGAPAGRRNIVGHSLVAVHTLLAVDDGRFVSLFDPPEFAKAAIATCSNEGTFPVLAGQDGGDGLVLSSPIILYDHPEVAPESQGDMCDATEIDEILALRVLTLTDEEKREARGTDARAAAIVDRCDAMPPELWERLHGAVRSLRPMTPKDQKLPWWEPAVDAAFDPWSDTVWIGATEVSKGSRVRLHPNHRADVQDMFVAGRTATVEGVFHDVDEDIHVAVVLDDDQAADLHRWHGRYLYFHPDEVEPLS
jgi:hypothetical protein